jgi:hypothetical protein
MLLAVFIDIIAKSRSRYFRHDLKTGEESGRSEY